jgi:hypothetical protein
MHIGSLGHQHNHHWMGYIYEGKHLHRKTVGRLKGTTGTAKTDVSHFDQVVWSSQNI